MTATRFPCQCCGSLTRLRAKHGTWDICPVCRWQDDPLQAADADYAGGANRLCLREHGENYHRGFCPWPRDAGVPKIGGNPQIDAGGGADVPPVSGMVSADRIRDSRMSVPEDDWRRQGQEKSLRGLSFTPRNYSAVADPLAHNHCEFCYRKFSHAPEDLHEGFATEDLSRWVCPGCYRDFASEYRWAPPGDQGANADGRP